jgi:threonylcarbamoyladenosine tRNA methylthiotransferase MtaB
MVYIITYGCKVNQYESLQVVTLLNSVGINAKMIAEKDIKNIAVQLKMTGRADETAFVVNSCAVTGMAEKKSRYGISKIKTNFPNAKIYLMGCAFEKKSPKAVATEIAGREIGENIVIHKRERAFIKVQDGCKNFCSFCIIPHKREILTSREIGEVVAEINAQPEYVAEIVISGINLCYYNTADGCGLGDLCIAVDKCGRRWGLSSLEPPIITPEFVADLRVCKRFNPSFHICLQSGSDRVLRDMNRQYTTSEYLQKINLVRSAFPDAKISTDIIVGYPTETDADFTQTIEFVKTVKFDSVHIFPYSPRNGTMSAELKPITNSVVTKRFNTLKKICGNK